MDVHLIKRKKIKHIGIILRQHNRDLIVSVCNGLWKADDKVSITGTDEVTCKRCLKILSRTDERGGEKS